MSESKDIQSYLDILREQDSDEAKHCRIFPLKVFPNPVETAVSAKTADCCAAAMVSRGVLPASRCEL